MQLGNVWITVQVSSVSSVLLVICLCLADVYFWLLRCPQPLLGVEGDPMRLLFERDLTPHPQYCAAYEWMRLPESQGGIGAHAVIHMGMHGTLEWCVQN
jgi:hypothetical protein